MDTVTKKILGRLFLVISAVSYIFFIIFVFFVYFRTPNFIISTDVISFLTGAKIIKDGNTSFLYDVGTQLFYQNEVVSSYGRKLLLPFRNFPVTAFLYTPLLGMDLKFSYALIFVLNLILLIIFHFVFIYFFPVLKKYKYLFLIPLFFYPSVSNLIVGQYIPLVLLIFLLIYLSIKKKKSFLSGFASSLLAIKPQYLLFSPFSFVLTKDKKGYLLGFVTGLVIIFTLNIIISGGINPLLSYPNFILTTENSFYGSRPYQMYTLYGLFKQMFQDVSTTFLIKVNLLIYIVLTLLVFAKKKILKNIDTLFAIGIIFTILFSVHALTHDLILFLMPIYIYLVIGKNVDFKIGMYIFITVGLFSLITSSIVVITAMIVCCILLLSNYQNPLFGENQSATTSNRKVPDSKKT